MQLLLNAGFAVDAVIKTNGGTSLHQAALEAHAAVVQQLLWELAEMAAHPCTWQQYAGVQQQQQYSCCWMQALLSMQPVDTALLSEQSADIVSMTAQRPCTAQQSSLL